MNSSERLESKCGRQSFWPEGGEGRDRERKRGRRRKTVTAAARSEVVVTRRGMGDSRREDIVVDTGFIMRVWRGGSNDRLQVCKYLYVI